MEVIRPLSPRLRERQGILEACKLNELFNTFRAQTQQQLVDIAERMEFQEGEHVFYAAQEGASKCYLVEKGHLLLTLSSGKTRNYGQGDLFGEIAVLNDRPRMGSVKATSPVSLIAFDGDKLGMVEYFTPQTTLEVVRGLTSYVISYLDETEYKLATANLISKGEGIEIEFKQSLSKTLKKKVLETICAFYNTRGGVILLGVNDEAEVVGLKVASEKALDLYKLDLVQKLKKGLGSQFGSYITFNHEMIRDKLMLRINCAPTPYPAIWDNGHGQQVFYMRSGPSNIKAPNIKEILTYYEERFNKR